MSNENEITRDKKKPLCSQQSFSLHVSKDVQHQRFCEQRFSALGRVLSAEILGPIFDGGRFGS